MHPEKPVHATDACAFGRNYFSRPSAIEQESEDDADESARILADVQLLKKLAVDYLHPEKPVATDASACARNYFMRASATEQESEEEADERDHILADVQMLKKSTVDYLHPERPIATDSTTFARNYFTRASAAEHESEEDVDERDRILAEIQLLNKSAVDYLHPEKPLATDATACARQFRRCV